jgi:hypothetical protein
MSESTVFSITPFGLKFTQLVMFSSIQTQYANQIIPICGKKYSFHRKRVLRRTCRIYFSSNARVYVVMTKEINLTAIIIS